MVLYCHAMLRLFALLCLKSQTATCISSWTCASVGTSTSSSLNNLQGVFRRSRLGSTSLKSFFASSTCTLPGCFTGTVALLSVTRRINVCIASWHGALCRDIKPENLLLDGDGQLKVTDLGVSSETADGTCNATSGTR